MAFWAALPAIASVASAFLKPKKGETVSQQPLLPEFQMETGEQVAKWLQENLGRYNPNERYEGPRVAGMSPFEETGLNLLQNYLGESPGSGELFQAGKKQVLDTLGGKYSDASTNPFIQSMLKLSNQNLQDSIDQARGRRGARGTYFTRAGLQEEGQLQERTLNALNSVIAGIQEQERGRQFQAAPIAQTMDQYETGTAPLAKIEASQRFGALPRTIEQAGYEADYQDWLRARGELYNVPGQAISLYNASPQYGFKDFQGPSEPSSLQNILGVISKLNLGSIGKPGGSVWDIFSPAK